MTNQYTKLMNTMWVRKYIAIFMAEEPRTKSYISQEDTEVSDSEDFDCITILHNKAQERAYYAFIAKYLTHRDDIRAGYILIE